MDRPIPPVVAVGGERAPLPPPADAIVLFNGASLPSWQTQPGKPAGWKIEDGYMEIVPGSGSIYTRQEFGDCQLHFEWRKPTPPAGDGQAEVCHDVRDLSSRPSFATLRADLDRQQDPTPDDFPSELTPSAKSREKRRGSPERMRRSASGAGGVSIGSCP